MRAGGAPWRCGFRALRAAPRRETLCGKPLSRKAFHAEAQTECAPRPGPEGKGSRAGTLVPISSYIYLAQRQLPA